MSTVRLTLDTSAAKTFFVEPSKALWERVQDAFSSVGNYLRAHPYQLAFGAAILGFLAGTACAYQLPLSTAGSSPVQLSLIRSSVRSVKHRPVLIRRPHRSTITRNLPTCSIDNAPKPKPFFTPLAAKPLPQPIPGTNTHKILSLPFANATKPVVSPVVSKETPPPLVGEQTTLPQIKHSTSTGISYFASAPNAQPVPPLSDTPSPASTVAQLPMTQQNNPDPLSALLITAVAGVALHLYR